MLTMHCLSMRKGMEEIPICSQENSSQTLAEFKQLIVSASTKTLASYVYCIMPQSNQQ